MGAVHRAEDTRLGREVAIKVMPAELAADPQRRQRFEQEARAVAALIHPNIVTIFSVEQTDGVLFITMELIEGQPRPVQSRDSTNELSDQPGAVHSTGSTFI